MRIMPWMNSSPHTPSSLVPPLRVMGLTLFLLLSACSPALNWREVRPAQADALTGLFPCQPQAVERVVSWPGVASGVSMHLLSCQTGDVTWALSYMAMPDVALVGPALPQLTAQLRSNLQAASQMTVNTPGAARQADQAAMGQDQGPITVSGMTPAAGAHAWRFLSQRPDGLGAPLNMDIRAWHFSHGLRVFQASVWRPAEAAKSQTSEDVANAFLSSFHFPR